MDQTSQSLARLIDMRAAADRCGCKRGKWYEDIQRGLMTPPIRIGPRFSRWPEHEVDSIVKARIAGADDNAIRELVADLLARRRGAGSHA